MVAPTVDGAVPAAPRRAALGPRIVGVVLVAAGGFLGYVALREADGQGVAVGGPRFAPLLVTGAWTVLAIVYLTGQLLRTPAAEPAAELAAEPTTEPPTGPVSGPTALSSPLAPVVLVAALLVYIGLLEPLGFALASTAFFVAASRTLGSRSWLRDVVVGAPLAFGAYLAFTRLLDIRLPAGVLPL